MGRHWIGEFGVEVIHQVDEGGEKPKVVIIVRLGSEFVERAVFDFVGFNSGELRRKLLSLEAFTMPRLKSVIEDARKWPKAKRSRGMTKSVKTRSNGERDR